MDTYRYWPADVDASQRLAGKEEDERSMGTTGRDLLVTRFTNWSKLEQVSFASHLVALPVPQPDTSTLLPLEAVTRLLPSCLHAKLVRYGTVRRTPFVSPAAPQLSAHSPLRRLFPPGHTLTISSVSNMNVSCMHKAVRDVGALSLATRAGETCAMTRFCVIHDLSCFPDRVLMSFAAI